MALCVNCGSELSGRARKYCSESCKVEYKSKEVAVGDIVTDEEVAEIEALGEALEAVVEEVVEEETFEDINFGLKEPQSVEMVVEVAEAELEDKYVSMFEIEEKLRQQLIDSHGANCMKCGWGQRNPVTNEIVLDLGFIDGDIYNLDLGNLLLLCPNCLALT